MAAESCSRFSDVEGGPPRRLPPLYGFESKPLVSLREAVDPVQLLVPDVSQMLWTIEDKCKNPKDGLTPDESASIMLYTLEWAPSEKSFFHILNTALRSDDRRKVTPWFLYLRLIVHALSKLPLSTPRVIYRGVKGDFEADYGQGNETIWWSFSSCTESMRVLDNYVGNDGPRTIFNILCRAAIDIRAHSYFRTEEEFLLYPGRQFRVRSSYNAGNGLHIVDMEETEPPFCLFQLPAPAPASINILLLGEEDVGKATFINALVNYLESDRMELARPNATLVMKPLSFPVTLENTFETLEVRLGNWNATYSLPMQRCQTYTYKLKQSDQRELRIIDTPSFTLPDGSNERNSATAKHILDYVSTQTHLNAICLLVKPDAQRLSKDLQLCFAGLVNRLGGNAVKNVIFCFTHVISAHFSAGSTVALLRGMFTAHHLEGIELSRKNSFGFDNRAFRFLLAERAGFPFTNEDRQLYQTRWRGAAGESKRLIDYIRGQLTPCQIGRTV